MEKLIIRISFILISILIVSCNQNSKDNSEQRQSIVYLGKQKEGIQDKKFKLNNRFDVVGTWEYNKTWIFSNTEWFAIKIVGFEDQYKFNSNGVFQNFSKEWDSTKRLYMAGKYEIDSTFQEITLIRNELNDTILNTPDTFMTQTRRIYLVNDSLLRLEGFISQENNGKLDISEFKKISIK